ncbi:MAG: hypothetical protein AAFQ43_03020, partial [Bacteroidota bacterium]
PETAEPQTEAEIDAAVQEAIAAATAALADSTAPAVLEGLMTEAELAQAEAELKVALDSLDTALQMLMTEMGSAMAEAMSGMAEGMAEEMAEGLEMAMDDPAAAPEASGAGVPLAGPRKVGTGRLFSSRAPQAYPTVSGVYGGPDDGFPAQTEITGVVEDAGSQRLCRDGRPSVSRWLKVRLTDTPADYPPVHIVVAVECDELDARHYVGRRVSMTAWKAISNRPVRMARNDVPEVDAPLYLTYPGNVSIGG